LEIGARYFYVKTSLFLDQSPTLLFCGANLFVGPRLAKAKKTKRV